MATYRSKSTCSFFSSFVYFKCNVSLRNIWYSGKLFLSKLYLKQNETHKPNEWFQLGKFELHWKFTSIRFVPWYVSAMLFFTVTAIVFGRTFVSRQLYIYVRLFFQYSIRYCNSVIHFYTGKDDCKHKCG